MKRLAFLLMLLPTLAAAAQTPSPNLNDQQLLAADATFEARVVESLIATCNSIANEAVTVSTISIHVKRSNQCQAMLTPTALSTWKSIVADMVATDASVIGDATVAGATPLTTGNAATQAALVTDAHIGAAISSQFNTLLTLP